MVTEKEKSTWSGFMVLFVFSFIAFAQDCHAQSGNFFSINGEYGEAALHLYGNGTLAVCHNGHRWLEQVDSVSAENPKFSEVFTGYARWELWYDRKESGLYNKNAIREAWCYQFIGDPIHYHE